MQDALREVGAVGKIVAEADRDSYGQRRAASA
jgi:hypothetical protein